MSLIDLHLHSCYSDGSYSLQEIQQQVKEKGMQIVSITDHDTFEAYEHLPAYPMSATVIKGIELSAYDPFQHKNVHILGYGFGACTPHVDALCVNTRKSREIVTEWQVQSLANHGYSIHLEEVQRKGNDATCLYKQHIMDVLIEKGYTDRMYGTLYQKLFKQGGICECAMPFITVEQAIDAIRKDQGIAVVAHPCLSGVVEQIPAYIQLGLQGIETYHSSQSEEQIKQLHAIALQYQLMESGGSDCHGRYGNEPAMGEFLSGLHKEELSKWLKIR